VTKHSDIVGRCRLGCYIPLILGNSLLIPVMLWSIGPIIVEDGV